MIRSRNTLPVFICAAWSLTFDSVVLVKITKGFVPDSLLAWVWFPEESINGEDTNTGQIFSSLSSDSSFKANNFWGIELESPLLLENRVSASVSLRKVISGHILSAWVIEVSMLMIFSWSGWEWKKWIGIWDQLEVLISSKSFKTNWDLFNVNNFAEWLDHVHCSRVWFFVLISPVWAVYGSWASSKSIGFIFVPPIWNSWSSSWSHSLSVVSPSVLMLSDKFWIFVPISWHHEIFTIWITFQFALCSIWQENVLSTCLASNWPFWREDIWSSHISNHISIQLSWLFWAFKSIIEPIWIIWNFNLITSTSMWVISKHT